MGALILAAGQEGKRFALPHSRVMIHQPLGGYEGSAADIGVHAKEILRVRHELNGILVKHTGQTLRTIEKDTDRDRFMTAEMARDYHIIDEILERKAKGPNQPEGPTPTVSAPDAGEGDKE